MRSNLTILGSQLMYSSELFYLIEHYCTQQDIVYIETRT